MSLPATVLLALGHHLMIGSFSFKPKRNLLEVAVGSRFNWNSTPGLACHVPLTKPPTQFQWN
eukprot:6156909-Amphidinium_carterae.1